VGNFIDLKDRRFGRLVVKKRIGSKRGYAVWSCECDCGGIAEVMSVNLIRGNSQSCGCLNRERSQQANTTHGMCEAPEYKAYQGAKHRCNNSNDSHWNDYGGRGIKFLFNSFEQFYAELGSRPSPEYSVDRYPNNDGNYEPGNVRWATAKEQILNRRVLLVSQEILCEIFGEDGDRIWKILREGILGRGIANGQN